MIESVLGQDVLRQGLMDYLNENKFSNAETDDLWRSLSGSTNYTIEVKVSLKRQRDGSLIQIHTKFHDDSMSFIQVLLVFHAGT